MMFLLDGVFNFNMINYIKVRFFDYEESAFYLPRHSSFMIMHTFADWGRVRHNRAESLGITTVSTTKAHGWNWDKG